MTYAFTSTAPRTATFMHVLSRDGPVSSFSLHVHERLPSMLWVVGSGSLATLCSSYTHMGSTLDVMDYGIAKAKSPLKN